MPSTKKRLRSPEVDILPPTRQSMSIRTHQSAPVKRRCRGPKDDRIKALQKLKRRHRYEIFQGFADNMNTTHVSQSNTHVRCMAPASVDSPLQHSPGPAVPHSPPELPEGGYEDEQVCFNNSPVPSNVPLGSGPQAASSVQDNRALFRKTKHLDDHTSAWNKRHNSQATQWKSVTIPQLMPIYLENRAATKSGRLPPPPPPPPRPNNQCQCNKVALKVNLVTWDQKFCPHLLQLFADCVYIRILAEDIVYLRVRSSWSTVSQNGLLPLCAGPPNARLRYQPSGVYNDWVATDGTQCNRVVKRTSIFPLHPWVSCW